MGDPFDYAEALHTLLSYRTDMFLLFPSATESDQHLHALSAGDDVQFASVQESETRKP